MNDPNEPSHEETMSRLERARNEAISIAAKSVGCTTEEIEAWLTEDDGLRATEACLSIDEIDSLPFISEARLEHLNQCEFCQKVIKLFSPTEEEMIELMKPFERTETKKETEGIMMSDAINHDSE